MLQTAHKANSGTSLRPEHVRLAVGRLTLTDFRNYASQRIEVDASSVVLTGSNGAGKTNILEALSYLVPGRGLRGARLADLARLKGAGGWAVAAQVETPAGIVALGTGVDGQGAGTSDESDRSSERRVVRIDGVTVRGPAALGEIMRIGWLTPQMDRLFLDGRSERRRFLDRLVQGYDSDHSRRVGSYERAMRERLRLLRDGNTDDAWLGALEGRMAEHSVAIAAVRRQTVDRLRGAVAAGIGPFPRADLSVTGTAEEALGDTAAVDVEAGLQARLKANRAGDRESGRTREGAHRADLQVVHLEREMPAELCSTGEQKALLVAIVLADARLQRAQHGTPPVLLLDEIAAHLDGERRDALFCEIAALGAQAWLTGTDVALFDGLEGVAQFGTVESGSVTLKSGTTHV